MKPSYLDVLGSVGRGKPTNSQGKPFELKGWPRKWNEKSFLLVCLFRLRWSHDEPAKDIRPLLILSRKGLTILRELTDINPSATWGFGGLPA